jgi:hypothetical protein
LGERYTLRHIPHTVALHGVRKEALGTTLRCPEVHHNKLHCTTGVAPLASNTSKKKGADDVTLTALDEQDNVGE